MKKIMMIIMAVALIALPTMAQQQEWKSTSTMQVTGSSYAPQVISVGATAATEMATTTDSYSLAKAPGGPRRVETPGGGSSGEGGTGHNNPGTGGYDSPVGDAMLPLTLLAAVYGVWCMVYKRRKQKGISE